MMLMDEPLRLNDERKDQWRNVRGGVRRNGSEEGVNICRAERKTVAA